MGMLIDRYFARQVLETFLGVSVVLLVIFLANRLVRYLAEAAAGELPGSVILSLVGLKAVKYAILLLPLGLYLAVLLVLGRMYRDNEMAALAACGVGPTRLYVPVLGFLGLPLALFVGWLSLYSVPWTARVEHQLVEQAQRELQITGVQAGRFRETATGGHIIYAQEASEDRLTDVFVRLKLQGRTVVLSAKHARLEHRPAGRYVVLLDGYRYEGEPGAADYRVVRFQRHGVRVRPPPASPGVAHRDARPTAVLWRSEDPGDIAELQWRLAVPVSVLVLGVLAVPVGRTRPRQGRYARLLFAILLYVLYVNLLAVAEEWTENGVVPPMPGLWWVHGLMLVLAAGLLLAQGRARWFKGRATGSGSRSGMAT